MTDVGFIGLGTMGGPMALNVLRKGHRLTVFDISDKAVAVLTAAGATAAASPKAVAASSEVVITMVPDLPTSSAWHWARTASSRASGRVPSTST